MRHRLICHPATPASKVDTVYVDLYQQASGALWFEYHVAPSNTLIVPQFADPVRADGLWKTTCFELFAKPSGGDTYFEFNFSPSFEWAAYAFDGYRLGMRELPCDDPEISVTPGSPPSFFLSVEAMPELPSVPMRLNLTAVIEEIDGTKSYWALAHPAGKPDFHHPDGFVLELPAPM